MSKKKHKLTDRELFTPYSLLDRYIITEIALVFTFSLGILSSLGVAIGNLSDLGYKIFEFNLPLDLAFQVLLWKIPEFVAYALPISLLLATLITYGRFSSDSELIACLSCGVSLYRLIAPTLVFSMIVSGLTLVFTESVVPFANYQAAQILEKVIPEETKFTQKNDIFYAEYKIIDKKQKITTLFYAKKFDGKDMNDVTVLVWSEQKLEKILSSRQAFWSEQEKLWTFINGVIYQVQGDELTQKYLNFQQHKMSLSSAPLELAQKSRDPYQMNIAQSLDYLKIISQSGDEKKILMFQVRTQQKMAFPFICLVFGLVGSAIGVGSQQMGRGTSLGISVIIVFLYYLFGFLIGSLGLVGFVSPFMAAWSPNVLALVIGSWILFKNAS
ncbi:LptF/LptG family permease [Gloeocapsa sp. PCC 73106]|uniref:LptF/LptG family permease n=1 Tax=Gloeocapsa sp. PCC 73106 TaxID=102232 RepID=UPI0002AC8C7D|nr:LptF/LptG family permease [Gloeocapsa sp. PCC 73106]ELR97486.1 putative permease [Gloeocapsa sp. PCC 73106]